MLPPAAREFYAFQQQVNFTARNEVRRLWRRMGDDFDASWRRLGPPILAVLTEAQRAVSEEAARYVPAVLEQVDIPDEPMGEYRPESLVGRASDGRPLDSLTYGAVVQSKTASGSGLTVDESLLHGQNWLDLMTGLQIADMARQAVGVQHAAQRKVSNYVRVLTPPSCQRCAILAGRVYKWSTGFQRHPRCFPAGTVVSGPGSEAATRRWFEGELVVFTTASGEQLSLTGNHPVLTRRGWVPANLLQEGDEVVRSTDPQGAAALVVPDHHQMPARIEDVWGALSVTGFDSMPTSPEDFHGDGQHGEVDVVWADRALNGRRFASVAQPLAQQHLAVAAGASLALNSQGAAIVLDLGNAPHPGGPVSRLDLLSSLLVTQGGISQHPSLAHASALHPSTGKHGRDGSASDPELAREGVLTSPGLVSLDDHLSRGQLHTRTRWDAPTLADSAEQRAGYAAVGLDLLDRLAGQVHLDRVVLCRSVDFRGHVYSLTSSEGWHVANNLIVSNCDCQMMPARNTEWAKSEGFITSPRDAYEQGQIKDLTKAQIKAIEDGADIGKVVNAYRDMSTTSLRSRTIVKSVPKVPGVLPGHPDLLSFVDPKVRFRSSATPLQQNYPTPEGIYALAGGDRERAVSLLREWGYLD